MGNVILEESSLNDIGDAIRSKLGVETTYLPREMAAAIMSIDTQDVIEGYLYDGAFYVDAGHTQQVTGESGNLYVDVPTGGVYRWDGSQYVEVSGSLELGETEDTAYRGDRGKVAYDHARLRGSQFPSGLYKIGTNSEGHVTDAVAVQKSDITSLGIPPQDTTYDEASGSESGLMSAADKQKLDGIASGATADSASSSAPLMDGTASAGSSDDYARGDHVHPTDTSRMAASLKGAANGVAELDSSGKVPSSQLPSYVDDVLEYATMSDFPATGETGKIYVDLATNKAYRWSGSAYVSISNPLDYATQAEAEAGVENTHVMTPLRVKQAIDENAYELPEATTTALGGVKYDGSTITKNNDGQLHVPSATTSTAGLMSASDKSKLDGVASGATANTASSTVPVVDGTASVGSSSDYARADHVHPTDTSRASTDVATASTAGLMSAADKSKLDGIANNANDYTLPPATTETIGGVKPDGETISVDEDGMISTVTTAESDGTDAGPIFNLTAEGHAEQATTTGKNLWPSSSESVNSNNITFNVNDDGSITVTGTASGLALHQTIIELPSGTYTVSGCPTGGSDDSYEVRVVDHDRSIDLANYDTGSGSTFTVNSTIRSCALRLRIASGYACPTDGITFYPQLELGTEATDYEPYTGGAPSPSPDYPQEIQVVRGRNLLKSSDIEQGNIGSNGANIESNARLRSTFISVLAGETYTFSTDTDEIEGAFKQYSGNTTSDFVGSSEQLDAPFSLTIPNGITHIRLWLKWKNGAVISPSDLINPQLERGSVATPYVPYGCVEMEAQGKNLLDESLLLGATNWKQADDGSYYGPLSDMRNYTNEQNVFGIDYKPNTQYTMRVRTRATEANKRASYSFVYTDGTYSRVIHPDEVGTSWTDLTLTSTAGKTIRYFYLSYYSNSVIYMDKLQIELGSTATDYEPYYHSTTPIPLPSRGWVGSLPDGTADILTLDGAGKVTWEEKTEEVVLNGSEVWTSKANNTGLCCCDLPNGRDGYPQNNVQCDAYRMNSLSLATMLDQTARYGIANGHTFFLRDTIHADTVANLKTWLSTHPVTVLYPLATPVTEELGYIDLPDIPDGATISILELDALNVRYVVDDAAVTLARQWYERARSEYEDRIAALEEAVAEIIAG